MIFSNFQKADRPVKGILGEAWYGEVLNLNIDPGVSFENITKIRLYCAGDDSRADPDTLRSAEAHIKSLGSVVGTLYRGFEKSIGPDFEHCVRAIYVPFQKSDLFFVDLRHNYGISTYTIKKDDCSVGASGIHWMGSAACNIAEVIELVQKALNKICGSISNEKAKSLKDWISSEKFLGHEIVDDLIDYLEESDGSFIHVDQIKDSLYAAKQMLKNGG